MPVPALPSGRKVLLLDLFLVLWTLVWIAVGINVADTVSELTVLNDGFVNVGEAIETAGGALRGIELPLVGSPLDDAAEAVQGAGQEVSASGRAGREEVERAAFLLGTAVALIPVLPLLLFYLPLRLSRQRDLSAVRAWLDHDASDPTLHRFLAERAAVHVPYARLRRLGDTPWRDLAEGRHEALAGEELRRLGLSPGRLEGARPPASS